MSVLKIGGKGGYALGTVIILAFISAVMVAAFLSLSLTEFKIVYSNNDSIAAFHIAEAGLAKGGRLLYEDFVNTPEGEDPSWLDTKFYFDEDVEAYEDAEGYTVISPVSYLPHFYVLQGTTAFGGGTYVIEIANIEGRDDMIWVRSTGTYRGKTRAVLSKFYIRNVNPWNNAIFAGAGLSGTVINGCVDIRGSVHILGEEGNDGPVMDMVGSAYIGNNYVGMRETLASKVPSIVKMVDGQPVETLDAQVRVGIGQISLNGFGTIGASMVSPEIKYTVDGTFVEGGFVGNQGVRNVYSDNGTSNPYDIRDDAFDGFPRITDPYEGYDSYMDYLRDNALVISDPVQLNDLTNIKRNSTFSYSSEKGEISMDGSGHMTISGIVVIEGDFGFAKDVKGDIEYTGSAAILATGNVTILNDVVVGSGEMFPTTSIMGLMTPNTITFDRPQLEVQGVFYAQDTITSTKQTEVTGTFFANYFDMGQEVPSIFQVPSVMDHLPGGMFGTTTVFSIAQSSFREVDAP